jgi:undecaprenyl-diphosphatase
MDFVMESANEIGSRDVTLGVLLTLGTLGDEKARDASKLSVVSLVSGQLVCGALKASVNRPRPEEEESPSRWNSSFPSGHAAGAFSLATVFSNKYPRLRPVFYLVASAVALSRIYLGRHYPSDVLVGSLIGYASSRVVLTHEAAVLRFTF